MAETLWYCCIACAFAQIVYGLLFLFAALRNGHPPAKAGPAVPVSVIVAARNEAGNLRQLLPALLAQGHPEFEIIVANDRSADQTARVVQNFARQDKRVRLLNILRTPTGWNPKKYALQQAIASARHNCLLFTDADCLPLEKKWIFSVQAVSRWPAQIVLGYSGYQKKRGLLNLFIRHETFYTAWQYFTFASLGLPYMGVGRNLSYTKALFQKSGGFKKIAGVTGGDDDLLVQQMTRQGNTVCLLSRQGQTVSKPETCVGSWFRQKLRHLAAGKKYSSRYSFLLGGLHASHAGFYLTAALLPLLEFNFNLLAALYIFRLSVLLIVAAIFRSRLQEKKDLVAAFPLTEILFVIYFLATGFAALVTKKVKWN